MNNRCPECGSYEVECISDKPQRDCACNRCLLARLEQMQETLKVYHNERQELRDILRVQLPMGEGTVCAEFGASMPLVEAAKHIVSEVERARQIADIEMDKTIAAKKEVDKWKNEFFKM